MTSLHIVETRDQVGKRRFSAARRPYQRNGLPFLDLEAHTANHLLVIVGKTDIPKFYFVFQPGHLHRIGCIGDLTLFVEQRQHPFPCRDSLIDVGKRIGEGAQRTGDLGENRKIHDKCTGLQITGKHQTSAINHQYGSCCDSQKLTDRRGQLLTPRHTERYTGKKCIDLTEFTHCIVDCIVPFQNFNSGKRLIHQTDHIGKALLHLRCRFAQPFDDRTDNQCNDRQEQNRKDGQLPRSDHKRDHESDDLERIPKSH